MKMSTLNVPDPLRKAIKQVCRQRNFKIIGWTCEVLWGAVEKEKLPKGRRK